MERKTVYFVQQEKFCFTICNFPQKMWFSLPQIFASENVINSWSEQDERVKLRLWPLSWHLLWHGKRKQMRYLVCTVLSVTIMTFESMANSVTKSPKVWFPRHPPSNGRNIQEDATNKRISMQIQFIGFLSHETKFFQKEKNYQLTSLWIVTLCASQGRPKWNGLQLTASCKKTASHFFEFKCNRFATKELKSI